jgi:hypothetical protein
MDLTKRKCGLKRVDSGGDLKVKSKAFIQRTQSEAEKPGGNSAPGRHAKVFK